MRDAAATARDVHRMQVWAGQAAALAGAEPAGELVVRLWQEAGSFAAGQLTQISLAGIGPTEWTCRTCVFRPEAISRF